MANVSSGGVAGSGTPDIEGTDISGRNVDRLQAGALGLPSIMLLSMASAAPLIGALGNIPLGIGLGNGQGMAAGYIWVTLILLLFSVGYAAMASKLTAAGGFYSFISHGIGRPFGLAAGWSAIAGYLLVECALIGALGYFTNNTVNTLLHVNISWVVWAILGVIICTALSWTDVKISAKVLGVSLIIETLALVVMDAAVLIKGGPGGTPLSPINPLNAFRGIAPGVGIFFAFWSYLGFEVLPNYAEESKNPRKHTRVGLYAAVTIIGLVYLFTSWAGAVGHGVDNVTKAATSDPVNFYYSLAHGFVGTWLADVMRIFVCISSLACALAFHQTTCRYFYALGREGILPRRLGSTHAKWKSPHVAVIFQGILVLGTVLGFIGFWQISTSAQKFSGNFQNAPYFELFGWMAIATTFFVLLNQVLSSIATVAFFRKAHHRGGAHWWSTLVAPVLGAVGMAAAIYLLASNLKTVGGDVVFVKLIPYVCVGWFLIGLAMAFWFRANRPSRYAELGRLVNRSMLIGEGEPVSDPLAGLPPRVGGVA